MPDTRTALPPRTGLPFWNDECDRQGTAGVMLNANVSRSARESNGTRSCRSVSVGFPITMMITGMVGNTLALVTVYVSYKKKENKRKKSFLLCIGSLALTDLFGQLLTSPIVISVYRAELKWERVDSSGYLCAFFGVCMTTFGLCALFMASAMAVERAMAVTNPHWYSNHMRTSVTKQTLAVIWCLVLLFALLPIAGVGKYTRQWPGTWCFISTGDTEVPGNMFFATTFASLGIFSLLVTVSCNVLTIRGLVMRCKTKSGASQSSKQWERLTTETVIQLLGIMCVLLVCWSPLLVRFQFYQAAAASPASASNRHVYYVCFCYLFHPLVYTQHKSKVDHAVRMNAVMDNSSEKASAIFFSSFHYGAIYLAGSCSGGLLSLL